MDIDEERLLYDIKLQDDIKLEDAPFCRLMKEFAGTQPTTVHYENVEFENSGFAKNVYKILHWNEQRYDVINSFWTTFSWAMHFKFKYPIKEAGNVGIYKSHNKTYDIPSFPEKYIGGDKVIKEQVSVLINDIPDIEEFSALCHCVANFMPCPESNYSFNKIKYRLCNVKDYLPLMINKIQKCIDDNEEIEIIDNNEEIRIDNKEIKAWHQWFIDNREKYSLEPYYDVIEKGKTSCIKGIPFFTAQSLKQPLPNSYEEVKECLAEMLARIKRRAALMLEKYSKGAKNS